MWWEHWFDNMMVEKIDGIVAAGAAQCKAGRLHVTVQEVIEPLWLYASDSLHGQNCILWHGIFFKKLGIIHSFPGRADARAKL